MRIRDTQFCVKLLKALGDPTRLRVIEALMGGSKHVGEINSGIGIEPSLLSHHLRVLKEVGLVHPQRDGKAVLYSLRYHTAPNGTPEGLLDMGCCKVGFAMEDEKPQQAG